MPKTSQSSQFMQQISSLMPHYCDRCGAKHAKSDLEVVNQDVEKIVCKLECTNCKNIYVFQVNSPSDGMFNTRRSSLKADINGAEVKKFSNTEAIENEEILDVFIALKDIKNIEDFKVLFEEESSSEE